MGYDSVAQFGDVKVLKNSYFVPLGSAFGNYIQFSRFSKLSNNQKDFALLRAVVAEEPIADEFKKFKEYTLNDTILNLTFAEIESRVNALKKDTLQISHFSNNHITGTITLKEQKLLFFSIPYDKGWNATVDGQKATTVLCNLGFTGIFLKEGEHKVQMDFELPHVGLSLGLSGAGILIFILLLLLSNFTPISNPLNKNKIGLREDPNFKINNNEPTPKSQK